MKRSRFTHPVFKTDYLPPKSSPHIYANLDPNSWQALATQESLGLD